MSNLYFSNYFEIDKTTLKSYGAFDISLINDLPLFIDPFLLYGSQKPIYKKLHGEILKYLSFLRDKSQRGKITKEEMKSWYMFNEIKQNWLGFSLVGNAGSGLGETFAKSMSANLHLIFTDFRGVKVTESIHLEKITLFEIGVGKDAISDFTCNLIKSFLLDYTEKFAKKNLHDHQVKEFTVAKAYFDYKIEKWMAKQYHLPHYHGDYVLLTPRDILTKDENWINNRDLRTDFTGICNSISNDQFRKEIERFYKLQLPAPKYVGKGRKRRQKKETAKEIAIAVNKTVREYPELIDYYIKTKELHKNEAASISDEKVNEVERLFRQNVEKLIRLLKKNTLFYDSQIPSAHQAALQRIHFLKQVIEDNDGYKLFYLNGNPIKREADLQVVYRLTWFSSEYDVNREVNNGRGPVDYKISKGAKESALVEFKLASNSKLKMNLQNQVKAYEKANNMSQSIKVILFFSEDELKKVEEILKELDLENDKNVIVIDASPKVSASNIK